MRPKHKILLAVDGAVNLVLGLLLVCFPTGLAEWLGLPAPGSWFYTTILGAVLFGIGVALFLELHGAPSGVRGLGLGGAIAINLCGGSALLVLLLTLPLDIPLRGTVILWGVGVLVVGIALAEIAGRSWKY